MSERSPATLAVWLVAGALALIAAWRLFGGEGGEEAAPIRIDGGTAAAGVAGSSGAAEGATGRTGGGPGVSSGTYVHVAGAVRRPGLYRLGAGARVATALQRAGGPLRRADVSAVNLAATLEDGQQVVVPRRGELAATGQAGAAGSAAGPGAAGFGAGAPKLSLAGAAVEQLEELDGIGPTLAQRIVDYREENGGFRSLDELREVEGIGEKRFASLKEALQP